MLLSDIKELKRLMTEFMKEYLAGTEFGNAEEILQTIKDVESDGE